MDTLRKYFDYIEEIFTEYLANPNQIGHNSSRNLPTREIPPEIRNSEEIF